MGEIERGEGRIDRKGNDAIRERHLVVFEAVALAAEHHRHALAGSDTRRQQRGCRLRGDHRLGLVMGARGRRQHERAVGDRRVQRVIELGLIENAIGAGGRAVRVDIGPAVARLDQP